MSGQLSFFSAASEPPDAADLAGLLCGPGQIVQRAGTARVSVILHDDWRGEALLEEYAERGLGGEVAPVGGAAVRGGPRSARTRFDPALYPLAKMWSASGSGKRVPAGFVLGGPSLRLWCIAAVRPWEDGYALGLGESDEACWDPVGTALAHAGLPAVFVGPRGGGPAYRLAHRRRLRRLGELIGDPPAGAPAGVWPGLAG